MSGRSHQTDSTYQLSAEVRHTREEQYQLRSGRSTVVINDSGSDLGDEFVARPEVKVEEIPEKIRVESSLGSLGLTEGSEGEIEREIDQIK